MATVPKLNNELIAAELVTANGNIAAVARKFGVARNSVLERIEKSEELRIVCKNAREGMLDNGESALYRAVLAGESWAVCFFLKTQGKSRGYIESAPYQDPANQAKPLVVKKGATIEDRPNE